MLHKQLQHLNLILASGSPRRQQFFKDLKLDFEIRLKEIEEIFPDELQAAEITEYLTRLKAKPFTNELIDNDLLVTSDTIVWHNNRALGKPKDRTEAIEMITSLSNHTHEVFTSVCFKTTISETVISDCTKVTFGNLRPEDIIYYVDTFEPYDKAGAYGIQEWFGFMAVTHIEGSYTNVMGLPTSKVYEYLSTLAKI